MFLLLHISSPSSSIGYRNSQTVHGRQSRGDYFWNQNGCGPRRLRQRSLESVSDLDRLALEIVAAFSSCCEGFGFPLVDLRYVTEYPRRRLRTPKCSASAAEFSAVEGTLRVAAEEEEEVAERRPSRSSSSGMRSSPTSIVVARSQSLRLRSSKLAVVPRENASSLSLDDDAEPVAEVTAAPPPEGACELLAHGGRDEPPSLCQMAVCIELPPRPWLPAIETEMNSAAAEGLLLWCGRPPWQTSVSSWCSEEAWMVDERAKAGRE